MKDRFFYPLAVLAIMGIIVLSMLPGRSSSGASAEEIIAKGYELSGAGLQKLTAAPGTIINFGNDGNGAIAYAVLASIMPKKLAGASAGVFGTLSPDHEKAFAGKKLKITIAARRSAQDPLETFQMAYFTAGVGDSGWKNFPLTGGFKDYSFTFTPNAPTGKASNDFIGIWPGEAGKHKNMDVRSIKVEVAISNEKPS